MTWFYENYPDERQYHMMTHSGFELDESAVLYLTNIPSINTKRAKFMCPEILLESTWAFGH